MSDKPASDRAARWAAGVAVAYVVLVAASAAYLRLGTFSLRAVEPTRLDTAWQLELVYLADLGQWSGRDFHYARGPLWQALVWLAKGGPHVASAAGVVTGMEVSHMLLGAAVAWLLAWRFVKSAWLRVAVFLALSLVSYGAGISTFRAMLTVAILVSQLPDPDRAPSFRGALLPALLGVIGLLYSFDRFPLALASVAALLVSELVARARRKQSLGPAWRRAGWFALALMAWASVFGALALLLGANPLAYVPEQRRIARAYGALWTDWEAGVRPENVAALVVLAALIGVVPILGRGRRWLESAWVLAALPSAMFAVIVTDRGHVFVGIAPLLVVLVLYAAQNASWVVPRFSAALLALVAFAGWFGSYPDSVWLSPRHPLAALELARHGAAEDAAYSTDVSRTLDWVKGRQGEGPLSCIALAPALTMVHALARVGGPTLLTLRWTEEQQRLRARALEAAACPYYVHQQLGFDDQRGPDWVLGEDFVTIAELYAPKRQIGVATTLLEWRPTRAHAERSPLPSPLLGRVEVVEVPSELSIPLGAEVKADELVALELGLHAEGLGAAVGALPAIEFRFESRGQPLSEYRQLFHATLGKRFSSLLSPDAISAEWLWMTGEKTHSRVVADSVRLRFRRLGRLSPERLSVELHSATLIRAPSAGAPAAAPACQSSANLVAELGAGHAFPRNVAARLEPSAFQIHPNLPPAHVAEVFFPIRPCESTCLFATLEVRAPVGSGDGVDYEIHVIDRELRPRVLSEHLRPGEHVPVEIALWPWAGRDTLLRVGTGIGQDPTNDWSVVASPYLGRCSARTGLADALREGWANASGSYELSGTDVKLPAETRELRYRARITKDSCLMAGVRGRSTFEAYVVIDGIAHRIEKRRVERDPIEVGPYYLYDWDGRDVELVLKSVADANEPEPVTLVAPRLARCPEAK